MYPPKKRGEGYVASPVPSLSQGGQASLWVAPAWEASRYQLETEGRRERKATHTGRVFLIGQQHVSPSSWTEISFSERKVNEPKMVQNGSHPLKPHIPCQRCRILVTSDVHTGSRTLMLTALTSSRLTPMSSKCGTT